MSRRLTLLFVEFIGCVALIHKIRVQISASWKALPWRLITPRHFDLTESVYDSALAVVKLRSEVVIRGWLHCPPLMVTSTEPFITSVWQQNAAAKTMQKIDEYVRMWFTTV